MTDLELFAQALNDDTAGAAGWVIGVVAIVAAVVVVGVSCV